jgi:ferredoxin-type protein NapH
VKSRVGSDAIRAKGWFAANRWLITRRAVQLGLLALFLCGPWLGFWIIKGNLNYSLTLGVLPLADPYVLLQSLVAGHRPERNVIVGALLVIVLYGVFFGRAYCSWVCPVNLVTDAAGWLRRRFGLSGTARISPATRYGLLAMTLIVSLTLGLVAWEFVNPVSMLHRGILYGMGAGWLVIAAVFAFDLLVAERGWCGHLCPVGAFYGLLGSRPLLRMSAPRREQCNDCADCYAVCPEPLVIKPALKGPVNGAYAMIASPLCTNCGRCSDVCSRNVFAFSNRYVNSRAMPARKTNETPPAQLS